MLSHTLPERLHQEIDHRQPNEIGNEQRLRMDRILHSIQRPYVLKSRTVVATLKSSYAAKAIDLSKINPIAEMRQRHRKSFAIIQCKSRIGAISCGRELVEFRRPPF